ncbi:MAG TPA: hypothetical protein VFP19_09465, partial [Candidatus Limnocylindrales bacterium]|nr:hypothetical protein [Candidatus Limnocylindrales bacterium]
RGRIVVDEAVLDLAAPPVDARAPRPRKVHRWSRHGKGRAPGGAPAPDAQRSTDLPPATDAPPDGDA